jgi:hypothetical protein
MNDIEIKHLKRNGKVYCKQQQKLDNVIKTQTTDILINNPNHTRVETHANV